MKFSIALIYGGEGREHEVSLVGRKNLSDMIDRERYEVTFVLISQEGEWFIEKEDEKTPAFPVFMGGESGLFANGKIIRIDVAIPLLHGDLGEDGIIVGALRAAHIKFVGCDVLAGAVCADKILTKLVSDALGLPSARWTCSSDENPLDAMAAAEKAFGYPMFIKPASLGSSIGISRVECKEDFTKAYKNAYALSRRVLIEEAVKVKSELECAYLFTEGKHYYRIGEILSDGKFYDFDRKYISHTETKTAFTKKELEAVVTDMADRLRKAIGIRQMARIDFFVTEKGEILFNEINTFPGMTKTSLYPLLTEEMGLARGEFINRLISEALL